jgi:hypothetical protein
VVLKQACKLKGGDRIRNEIAKKEKKKAKK